MSSPNSKFRSADGRLRAWLRILITVVAVLAATEVAAVVALPFDGLAAQRAAAGLVGAVAAVGVVVLCIRRLDRRRVRGYGLRVNRGWWLDLAVGAVIGLFIPMLAFGGMVAAGWMEVTAVWSAGADEALWTGLVAGTITYLGVGIYEELLLRGYFVSNAAEALARRRPPARAVLGSVAVSTLVFAALHTAIFTSQAPIWLAGIFFLLMGAILGLAYAYTGQLALPIGLHISVNLAGNHVFPIGPLEELERVSVVFRAVADGPGWITGEGGAAMVVATLLAGILVAVWIRLRHRPVGVDGDIAEPEPLAHPAGANDPQVGTTPADGRQEVTTRAPGRHAGTSASDREPAGTSRTGEARARGAGGTGASSP